MEVYRLTESEGERLRAIRLRSLRDAPDAFGSTYEENAERSTSDWNEQVGTLPTFVAVKDGSDVGMVRGAPDHTRADIGWLISMWIAPEARGQGAGDLLIGVVIEWARDSGLRQLMLDVGDSNEPAIGLYRRMGFERTGETGTLPPPREHILEHQRALTL